MELRPTESAEFPAALEMGVDASAAPTGGKAYRCPQQLRLPAGTECHLCEQPRTLELLCRIVAQVNSDVAWRDDLLQEGLLHLWRLEQERPRQRLSWYLKSCQFRLRNYMALGRSVDSWKRRHTLVSLCAQDEDELEASSLAGCEATLISEVSAGEIIRLLCQRLTAKQRAVLVYLADGLSSREIAPKLGISHKAVIKHRRKIASAALAAGITP
jgi:DNA-directed RNA polymerase specialized sigma24 family protein